jgi:hypothetical protein
LRIARRFNAGKPPARPRVPKGRPIIAQRFIAGTTPTNASEPCRSARELAMSETPSVVPDGTRFLPARKPSVETLGYSRLSLRDSQAAVFPFGPNGSGVQRYDLWVMTSSQEESERSSPSCQFPSWEGLFQLAFKMRLIRWFFGRPGALLARYRSLRDSSFSITGTRTTTMTILVSALPRRVHSWFFPQARVERIYEQKMD